MTMRFRRSRPSRGVRIFFATDIHGSEQCFRKFLNAAEVYDVDHLILGGDITGKFLVPITRDVTGRYSAKWGDDERRDLDEEGLSNLTRLIRRSGHYPFVGTAEEIARLADDEHRDQVFRKLVFASLQAWVRLAEERLGPAGKELIVAPGNDDFLSVDDALKGSPTVRFAEGKCLVLAEKYDVITTGYSNLTPWNTERELDEDALFLLIEGMASQARGSTNLIAVLHAPPYESELDSAPALTEDLRVRFDGGGVMTQPVGSTAVRDFITNTQPLLGLHGHVHEGRGTVNLGRTLCINPGSEYTEGVLAGAIVELGDGEVLTYQLVTG
jgi:uncharacterized protein